MKIVKLIQKLLLFSLIAFTITSCDLAASKATPTPLPTATATTVPTKTTIPTATATFTSTPWPTATPNATATAQYNEMSDVVSGLYDDGYLPSTDGKFTLLDDFSEQWAQLGWYQWTDTGWKPNDFVMTAHMAWKSDTKTPNPSGCGIVFRALPTYEHYVVFVYSIGYIRFGIKTDQFRGQHADYFGPSQNEGEVDFMLTAVGSKFDVFINGKHIKQYIGFDGKMTSGDLAYTVLSGTNAGFGTECTITNAKLWMVK